MYQGSYFWQNMPSKCGWNSHVKAPWFILTVHILCWLTEFSLLMRKVLSVETCCVTSCRQSVFFWTLFVVYTNAVQ
jgi:hypothetical protein